jgi:hypothetical protein
MLGGAQSGGGGGECLKAKIILATIQGTTCVLICKNEQELKVYQLINRCQR